MARLFKAPQTGLAASLLAGALLFTSVAPAPAQEVSGRMRVLVPAFTNPDGSASRAGGRLADQVRRQINQMPTHAPTEANAIRDALRQYQLRENDMDCIKWVQLAAQTNIASLVLCGTLDESTGNVTANFRPIGGGDAFEVPRFSMQSPEQGAQQVVASFQTYTRQLALVTFCNDHINNQSWQQALDVCTQAVELNPRSVSANYARGSALMNMDRNEDAFEAFRTVLEIEPINTDALLAAGIVASKLGRTEVSQQYLGEYLDLNPGDETVRLTIAHQLSNAGDPAGALRLVADAAAQPDASASLLEYAGHFAMNAGLTMLQGGPANGSTDEANNYFRQAVTSFERAVAMKGDSADAAVLRSLMLAHRNLGDIERALAIGQRATVNSEDAQVWLVYSDVLREAGRAEQSIAAMDRAAAINPELPGLATRRVVTLLEAGRLQEVVSVTRAALAANQMEASVAENVSQQITQRGFAHVQARRYDQAVTHFNAAREIGRSDRSIAMANFFHGFALVTQADGMLRTATTAGPARQARPLLDRARTLLQGAAAYPEQAAKRAELLQNVTDYIAVADALIRAGR